MDRKPGTLAKNPKNAASSLVWIKIVGIGNSGVGKTCLIKHFCESKFSSGYQPTVGVDYGFKIQSVQGMDLRVHLWDLSGNAEYLDVRNELYANTDAVFLAFDLTNQASFESLDIWLRELTKYANSPPEVILCGNKLDQKNKRVISAADANKWASGHKIKYYETSSSNGDGVEKMFVDVLEKIVEKKHLKEIVKIPQI
ncbi:dnaJ homolog subfamily C member 27-like [Lineus longissimus]|uniref:dnaJ homolog subfamily C member 27-like n=1 Tax=Lineus longissimus TaxID=88925 RepID=UPI002B4CC9B7